MKHKIEFEVQENEIFLAINNYVSTGDYVGLGNAIEDENRQKRYLVSYDPNNKLDFDDFWKFHKRLGEIRKEDKIPFIWKRQKDLSVDKLNENETKIHKELLEQHKKEFKERFGMELANSEGKTFIVWELTVSDKYLYAFIDALNRPSKTICWGSGKLFVDEYRRRRGF